MTFLFVAALFALPLAGLPVILHLLFRRKSPVVHFPTLRFVKAAIQHTAARRKIQRWLLLACRVILLALLIFSVAQPAKKLASAWMSSDQAAVAAIVVDTSYSMLLQEDQAGSSTTLLDKAEAIVQELLRDQLKEAKVAVFRSNPPQDARENFRDVAAIQKDWTGLKPEPNPVPLSRRVASALNLLVADPAPQKWLFVITDTQGKEFPHPIQAPPEVKTVLLDLHPDEPRSAGITGVGVDERDSVVGVGAEAVVEIAGRAGDSRAVMLTAGKAETAGDTLMTRGPAMVSFDSGGRAQVRFPMRFPLERYIQLKAALQAPDALMWDNERVQLIELPPRQTVTVIETSAQVPANRFLRLALDPSEGSRNEWPLIIKKSPNLLGGESVAAVNITQWPETGEANRLRDFVQAGGTLILHLQPGIEQAFVNVGDDARKSLLDLLPSAPTLPPTYSGAFTPAHPAEEDPVLRGLTKSLQRLVIRRFVPLMDPEGRDITTLLHVAPQNKSAGSRAYPLLTRKKLGQGQIYAFTTLPDPTYTNLALEPIYLPMVVRMSVRPSEQRKAVNVELGQPITAAGPAVAALGELQVETPAGEKYVAKPENGAFKFERADVPGLYSWRNPADNMKVVALSNVQFPSAEAELTYRPTAQVLEATDTHLVARSLPALNELLKKAVEPEPRWAMPLSIVMFLLCLEALMGSFSRLWQPIKIPWLTAKAA